MSKKVVVTTGIVVAFGVAAVAISRKQDPRALAADTNDVYEPEFSGSIINHDGTINRLYAAHMGL